MSSFSLIRLLGSLMNVELVWFFETCAGMYSLHEIEVGLKLLLILYVATFEVDLVDSSQRY